MHQHPLKLVALCAALSVLCSSLVAQTSIADPVLRRDTVFEFSWGPLGRETLSAEHQFKQVFTLTPSAFRQLMWQTPSLERVVGTRFVSQKTSFDYQRLDSIHLRINGTPLSFSRIDQDNGPWAAQLEAKWLPLAQRGATFRLEIPLDPGKTGDLTIRIVDPGVGEYTLTANRPLSPVVVGSEDLKKFEWGDLLNPSLDRDYLTVGELLKTIQAPPRLKFFSKGKAKFTCFVQLYQWSEQYNSSGIKSGRENFFYWSSEEDYATFQSRIQDAISMFTPGTVVEMKIEDRRPTANTPKTLLTFRVALVADDDPRLALRRSTDAHRVRIRVGDREERYNSLYLKQLVDTQGNKVNADLPLDLTWYNTTEQFESALRSWPQIWVDDQPCAVDSLQLFPLLQDTFQIWWDKAIQRLVAGDTSMLRMTYVNLPFSKPGTDLTQLFSPASLRSGAGIETTLSGWHATGCDLSRLRLKLVRANPEQKDLTDFQQVDCDRQSIDPRVRFVGLKDQMTLQEYWEQAFIEFDEPLYAAVRVAQGKSGEDGHSFGGCIGQYKFPAGRRAMNLPMGTVVRQPGVYTFYLVTARGSVKKQVQLTP